MKPSFNYDARWQVTLMLMGDPIDTIFARFPAIKGHVQYGYSKGFPYSVEGMLKLMKAIEKHDKLVRTPFHKAKLPPNIVEILRKSDNQE